MNSYDIAMYDFKDLEGAVKLPSYQRPVVWTKSERINFISNLHRGFPFGSLLLYRYPDDFEKKFTLIDGQQRYTTMRDYVENPATYFPHGDYDFVNDILNSMQVNNASASIRDDLQAKCGKIIEELLAAHANPNSQVTTHDLRDRIFELYPLAKNEKCGNDLLDLQQTIFDEFDSYLKIDDIKIPCVIFKGAESDLPDVFASVNLGGRKLTKYQVFAAQWNCFSATLLPEGESQDILERVIKRYEDLTQGRSGLEIEDFDADEMRRTRRINLPELCHALGQKILEVSPACWPVSSNKQDDTIDTIGYNTLAIIFGVAPQNISTLSKEYRKAGLDGENPEAIEQLITKVTKEYTVINERFAVYLHKPGRDSGSRIPNDFENAKAVGQLQFLSFFAALWRIKYGAYRPSLEPRSNYKTDYKRTRNNLFASYLVDMLNNQWKGSGDSRLASYIDGSRDYLSKPSAESLNIALNGWAEEEERKPSVNIDATTKILLTVFASSHNEMFKEDNYDFEHLISRSLLNGKDNHDTPRYKALHLPGGRVGNIMFLESGQNRGKHDKNLGAYAGEELEIKSERQFVPAKDALDDIEYELKTGNREPFMDMYKTRQKEIFAEIEKRVLPD